MQHNTATRPTGATAAGIGRAALVATLALLPIAAAAVDLIPVTLTRTNADAAGLPATPVRVRVVIANSGDSDMPDAVAHTGWTVHVQGYSLNPYVVRRALRAGEWHSFAIPVVVPCGKVTQLEVRVNAARGLSESRFDNNSASFPIRGNACPSADATRTTQVPR